MNRRLFGQFLVHLLAGAVIALMALNPLEAATKKTFSSKLLCDAVKVGCARKVSKAKSAQTAPKKTVTNKKKIRQPVLKTASKSKRKTETIARVKPDQTVVSPVAKLASKPRPKPPTLQPDTSKLATAAIEQAPPLERPKYEPPNPAEGLVPPNTHATCRGELLRRGVDFSIPVHVEAKGECKVVDPVQVSSIETPAGRVALPGAPIFNCEFARQFTVWLSDVAAPVVAALGEAKLSSLSTGGYQCRSRSGDSSAKLSEHAFGNAIDIEGITLTNKKRIEMPDVADKQDSDHRLLMALRLSACGYFTTVLGPGADAAHASHYHFDLGIHGKSGNYRICE
jgi:hypothetical protein